MQILSIGKIIYSDNSSCYLMIITADNETGHSIKIQKKQFDQLKKLGVKVDPVYKSKY